MGQREKQGKGDKKREIKKKRKWKEGEVESESMSKMNGVKKWYQKTDTRYYKLKYK
jgi:hypothetical protein